MSAQQLESALNLARKGFKVFPLRPGTKKPAVENWSTLATTDENIIRKVWSAKDFNVGVAMGGGSLGLDVDMKTGKNGLASLQAMGLQPEGFVVRTPSGGLHVYYAGAPDVRNTIGRVGDGLDIRSTGGFLVGPGSVIDGATYEVIRDDAIRRLPDVLAAALQGRFERVEGSTTPVVQLDRPESYDRAVIWAREAAPAVEGQGGDLTTFKVAARLKDMGISADMAAEILADVWNPRCSPPWPLEDLRAKIQNAFEYGFKPPGSDHPDHEFAGVDVENPAPKIDAPIGWYRHGDDAELDVSWLFYELLPAEGVGVLTAPSQGGKTFLLVELARCVATGKPFFGVQPDDMGGTLFVFAGTEGSGLKQRLAALGEEATLPISSTIVGDLSARDALQNLVNALHAEARYVQERHGVPVRMIVLETLAASNLINDENDNSEASRAMANLAQLARAMKCLVVTSHHPDKKGTGSRGASAILNSADYVLEVRRREREAVREIELVKARDASQRKLGTFTLLPVQLGVDKRGRKITSMTISQGEIMSNTVRVAPHFELLIECVEWAVMESDTTIAGATAANIEDVKAIFKDRKPGSQDRSNLHKQFNAAVSYAETVGAIDVLPHDGGKFLRKRESIT